MKWKKPDPRLFRPALTVFLTGAALMVFYKLLGSTNDLWKTITSALRFIWDAFKPFTIGFIFFYIFHPVGELFVKLVDPLFKKIRSQKLRRSLPRIFGLLIFYLLFIGLIAVAMVYVLPEVYRNLRDLVLSLPDTFVRVRDFIAAKDWRIPVLEEEGVQEWLTGNLSSIGDKAVSFINDNAVKAFGWIYSGIKAIINLVIGMVVSYYMMLEKDVLAGYVSRVGRAYLQPVRRRRLTRLLQEIDLAFGRYISARLIESLIFAVILMIGFVPIGLKFSVLMAVMMGICNLIPYFGGAVGTVVVALVGLISSPRVCLMAVAYLLIIQGLDNYVIMPKLFDDKIGLTPTLTLFAVLVGGALFGIGGMVLGVPVFAVIQVLVKRGVKLRTLRRRKEGAKTAAQAEAEEEQPIEVDDCQ